MMAHARITSVKGGIMAQIAGNSQDEIVRYLLSPETYPVPGEVTHITTHGAHVFLCGKVALKIKRAVRYDYMDLSTPELRHALLERELVLNRVTAPTIYRDVLPITRDPDGALHLNGDGPAVEWVLRMHRFAADCEMTAVAASGRLTAAVAEALGEVIYDFHTDCPKRAEPGDALIRDILDELGRVLPAFESALGPGVVGAFLDAARNTLATHAAKLRDRATKGHVRRVHGDLHLRNLLLLDGLPVLFDALEFDERLATCDVLYDLAFLLMDLCHQSFAGPANSVLNAYLLAASGREDSGMAALPLFMAVRAAIRAMVVLQTDQADGQLGPSVAEAQRYLQQAQSLLHPRKPVLLAVGGLSGTGKTVLARDLATFVAACPGAVHLRTDTERKAGTDAKRYDPAARAAIYQRMLARAEALLAAGNSVVLDATFLDPSQRRAAADLASHFGIAFHGLWLTAPLAVLIERVTARLGDASDADAAVVRAQLAQGETDVSGWTQIDASGHADDTRAAAFAALESMHFRPTA
jgi:uncharacterized protein